MRLTKRFRALAVALAVAAGPFAVGGNGVARGADSPLLGTPITSADSPLLGTPITSTVGQPRPFSICSPCADLDGDGRVDLAVTTEGSATAPLSGKLVIMHNNGDGSFTASQALPLLTTTEIPPGSPADARSVGRDVAAVDVDHDGTPDLVVADAGKPQHAGTPGDVPGWVIVYLNDGAGHFTRLPAVRVASRPLGLAFGDFNGDGKLDIGIDNEDVRSAQLLLGDGTGHFTPQAPVDLSPMCDSPHFPVAGDFNEDGELDLLVPCNNNGPVLLLAGEGDGTFAPPQVAAGTKDVNRPHKMAAANFFPTGKVGPKHLDFTVANTGWIGAVGRQSVFIGARGGKFSPAPGSPYPVTTDAGTSTAFEALGDFNGDGLPDIIVTSSGSFSAPTTTPNDLVILVNQGPTAKTSFLPEAAGPYLISTAPSTILEEVTVADFNGDGKPDVAVVVRPSSGNGYISVLLHN